MSTWGIAFGAIDARKLRDPEAERAAVRGWLQMDPPKVVGSDGQQQQ